MRLLKRFGPLAFTVIVGPFVLDRANSDLDKAPFTAGSVLLLYLICLGLSIAYSDLQRRYEVLKRARSAVPDPTVVNRALDHTVRPIDKDNRYTLIKLSARIDSKGNYYAQYERHGINHSRTGIDHLRILTAADSNADFNELGVEAIDLNRQGAKLKVAVVEDSFHLKLFDIFFRKPIQPNEQFGIAWSLHWPGAMRASSDYDFIVLKDFERGVEKLSYTLEFDKELSSYRFEKLGKNAVWEYLS